MKKKLTFLGIETSCDETAAAVVQENNDGTGKILSNIVSSQVEEHREFGGIVPEVAARAHVEKIEFIVQKAIKERRSLGELDHPDDSVINLKNTSHLVTKMWWDGENVMGKIEVLNTPSGGILKALVKSGVKLGISSRGMGSVKQEKGKTIVEDDYQLICFDMVSEPSTKDAYVLPVKGGAAVNIDPKINMYMKEGKQNKIDDLIDSILRD